MFLFLLLIGVNIWVYVQQNSPNHTPPNSTIEAKQNKVKQASTSLNKDKSLAANGDTSTHTLVEEAPYVPTRSFVQQDVKINIRASEIEKKFKNAELINMNEMDPSIHYDIRYGTTNNFMGIDMYGGFQTCYLQQEPARMLAKAQEYLKETNPKLSLLVLDCARPNSVQKLMWNAVKGTEKQHYVGPPKPGSIHNFGAAVDVTIIDQHARELDMGTAYDEFTNLSRANFEDQLAPKQLANRVLLREVMKKAGFRPIQREWWHFEAFNRKLVESKYKLID